METVGKNGSLVTDYAYEQNTHSDSRFLNDYLERQPVYAEEATLVADAAHIVVKVMWGCSGASDKTCHNKL